MAGRHRVVIIGGGFGGLSLANSLRHAPADVTLLDRLNYHLFQPLLYQVATGSLSPANIASPLREVLRDQKNVTVLLAEATHGRIAVEPDLTIPGHPEIFVIGDLANFSHQDGKPLPGVAQPAIQEGATLARLFSAGSRD
jgi:NADH dehydrogenase FAD-containing subunit